jgi:hypothetical protein
MRLTDESSSRDIEKDLRHLDWRDRPVCFVYKTTTTVALTVPGQWRAAWAARGACGGEARLCVCVSGDEARKEEICSSAVQSDRHLARSATVCDVCGKIARHPPD